MKDRPNLGNINNIKDRLRKYPIDPDRAGADETKVYVTYRKMVPVKSTLRACRVKCGDTVQKEKPGAFCMGRQEPVPGLVPGKEPATGQVRK